MSDSYSMQLRNLKSAAERRHAIQTEKQLSLDSVSRALLDDESRIHCENLIGAVSIPVGVAGPVPIHGGVVNGERIIPLATTEGALVGSVSRGMKAAASGGGITVRADRAGTTRGPAFYTGSIERSEQLIAWIKKHTTLLSDIAASTSRHLTLKNIMIRHIADHVFLRISYDTQDAMGMNMVTIATQAVIEKIEQETGIPCLTVAGNFDIDKKPAWLNVIENRGFAVWAEATISAETVRDVLKVTPKHLYDVWLGKCMFGSAMSGSLGFNAHFANIVAALFAATGQDLAHIAEGSMGMTVLRLNDDGSLYSSVYLPSLLVGVVGGGTGLSTQTELRTLTGASTSTELAELTGAAVLAGEISLLASLAEGTLAKAHMKLGR